jgi:exosortase
MIRLRWFCFTLAIAVGLLLFWPALRFSAAMFQDKFEDLSHGWVIPLVSAYAVWRSRDALRAAAGPPDARGLLAVLGCLALFWLGKRGEQARFMQMAVAGAVLALPLAFWGAGVARRLWFPAAYLLFAVPTSFLDVLTFRLRLLAASVAAGLLNGVGVAVQRVGTALVSGSGEGFKLDVADPCSGMHSIFALAALTAAYAYFTQKTARRRWLLFACAVPLAILGNVARIVSIALVALWFGQERAVGFYHDYSGYVVFVVAVLLMVQAGVWIERIRPRRPAPSPAPPEAAPTAPPPAAWRARAGLVCAAVPLVLAVGWLLGRQMPAAAMDPDDFVAAAQPDTVDGFTGRTLLYCQDDQCLASVEADSLPPGVSQACPRCGKPLATLSLGEKTVLPADTRIVKRSYRNAAGDTLSPTVVVSGASRLSIHRPEMCLPGQGFQILSARVLKLDLGSGRTLRVKLVQAGRTGEAPIGFLYWFVNRRTETPSHWTRIFTDVWSRSVHNRINRWAMVTLVGDQPFDTPEAQRAAAAFLGAWYPQVVPHRHADPARH